MGVKEHKKSAKKNLSIGIISVSTTRSLAEDKSGKWMSKSIQKEKHNMPFHRVIPDESAVITETVQDLINLHAPDAVIITGGTGISPKDVTIEAVRPLFEKELTAFGYLFAQLSFEEIDSAAILSRATAGIINKTVVFCIPGSLKACKLAYNTLIIPEVGHIAKHMRE